MGGGLKFDGKASSTEMGWRCWILMEKGFGASLTAMWNETATVVLNGVDGGA